MRHPEYVSVHHGQQLDRKRPSWHDPNWPQLADGVIERGTKNIHHDTARHPAQIWVVHKNTTGQGEDWIWDGERWKKAEQGRWGRATTKWTAPNNSFPVEKDKVR